MIRNTVWMAVVALMVGATEANATVVISTAQTENMTCSAGVCSPTADDAVLNVSDLESLLASGNLEVTTHGHHARAGDIVVATALSLSSSFSLTLETNNHLTVRKRISMQGPGSLFLYGNAVNVEAPVSASGSGTVGMGGYYGNVNIDDPVSVRGSGGLEIYGSTVNIGASVSIQGISGLEIDARSLTVQRPVSIQSSGAVTFDELPLLFFEKKGRITFANLSATLTIGSIPYTLENTLPTLAAAIAANPQGGFALANSYNASADGTYTASPIPTNFLGSLEGFGNAISNISINNTSACCVGGLFQSISEANVDNVRLTHLSVTSVQGAAGLAYESFGEITQTSVTGSVVGGGSGDIGGLVSDNYGGIEYSYSAAAVSTGATVTGINVGGLVGVDYGYVEYSFATGNISAGNGSGNIGGLIGEETNNQDSPQDAYATGSVVGGSGVEIGGLIGTSAYNDNEGANEAYSTGAVSGGTGSTVGGLIGLNNSQVNDEYWDTTTSGTEIGVGLGNASGITGLTTTQFQAGLPAGFDTSSWAENPDINNGLPYIILNPPPK